jgi:hypothetical protein
MIKYTIEDGNNSSNLFLTDGENGIKVLVAVIFDLTHAKIIMRQMNEHVNKTRLPDGDDDPFLTNGLAKIVP